MSAMLGTRDPGGRTTFDLTPRWITFHPDLSAYAKLLYVVLRAHTNQESGYAFPGRERLAAIIGCSDRTITKAVRELEEAGALVAVRRARKPTLFYTQWTDPAEEMAGVCQPPSSPQPDKFEGNEVPSKPSSTLNMKGTSFPHERNVVPPNDIDLTRGTSSPLRSEEVLNPPPSSSLRSEEGPPPARSREQAIELIEFWKETCGHPRARATADRVAKVRARLAEGFGVDEIRSAIRGASVAAYVDERGKRHDDLALICRNGSKLEDFIGRWERHENGEDVNPNPSVRGSGVRLRPDGLWSPTLDRLEAQRRRLEMAASKAPKGSGKGKQQGDPGEAGYSPVTAGSGDVRGTSG